MSEYYFHVQNYLEDCKYMKGLSEKTLKAYAIDLKQFEIFIQGNNKWYTKPAIESYIKEVYIHYKPRTAKRKLATLKAFFHYLELEEILSNNPFHKIKLRHKEALSLPRTIPVYIVSELLRAAYEASHDETCSSFYRKNALRDVAVIELLFSTGIRVNELCTLKKQNIDLKNKIIKVNGKGSKERYIYITNSTVITALKSYLKCFAREIERTNFFFINTRGTQLSEQSVRFMIKKYEDRIDCPLHVTPHMFRHTLATLLLEEDVDIRYIQELLGHSSITTTQIYTHISMHAQKKILSRRHPRNKIKLG